MDMVNLRSHFIALNNLILFNGFVDDLKLFIERFGTIGLIYYFILVIFLCDLNLGWVNWDKIFRVIWDVILHCLMLNQ